MSRLTHMRRLYLVGLAGGMFLLALGVSWGEGSDHLWLQGVAMVLALAACVVAALAARPFHGPDPG